VSVEDRLRALELEWPEEPDVAPRVRGRLERKRRRWPRIAIPVAVLALVAAVPPARSTVLDWLGIGGETIERVPEAPSPAPTATPRDLGTRISLPRDALIPSALGRPDAVYEAGDRVTLLYKPRPGMPEVLIDQFPGRTRETYVRKQVGPHTRVDRVTVQGEPGFWLSGASHSLLYEDPNGTVLDIPARLAGPTLVWRHGDRTLRLEADITKSRALAVARSIP
jgi:hypothetical protein